MGHWMFLTVALVLINVVVGFVEAPRNSVSRHGNFRGPHMLRHYVPVLETKQLAKRGHDSLHAHHRIFAFDLEPVSSQEHVSFRRQQFAHRLAAGPVSARRHANYRRHRHTQTSSIEPFSARSMLHARGHAVPTLEDVKGEFEKNKNKVKRPLMNSVNIMRVEMCWKRPNLMTHVKCMEFLGAMCAKGSTHKGICEEFTNEISDACEEHHLDEEFVDEHSEAEGDRLHHVRCRIANKLNPDVLPPNEDLDGDGVLNFDDDFPRDATESLDSDGDNVGDNADVFPEDPEEWEDSDGDGVGDNADKYPNNPNCHKDPCGDGENKEQAKGSTHVAGVVKPWKLNKLKRGLPEQGYNEHSYGKVAEHNDMSTYTSDWRRERPKHVRSEEKSLARICERHPNNSWCKRYGKHGRFAR